MMANKKAFLLSRARSFELDDFQDFYDEKQQLNIVVRANQNYPLVSEDNFVRTSSKTLMAPGDDDPDPEEEGCY